MTTALFIFCGILGFILFTAGISSLPPVRRCLDRKTRYHKDQIIQRIKLREGVELTDEELEERFFGPDRNKIKRKDK